MQPPLVAGALVLALLNVSTPADAQSFKSSAGNLKVEITKYPLADASKVHSLFEQRKTTGKLVLIP